MRTLLQVRVRETCKLHTHFKARGCLCSSQAARDFVSFDLKITYIQNIILHANN